METLLGADGTIKGTFRAIHAAKRQVQVTTLDGKSIYGLVAGPPGDAYVVLRPEGSDDEKFDVMVLFSATVTVHVLPDK